MHDTMEKAPRAILVGVDTGEYDADTEESVRRAQGVFQLPQTGETDRATWAALTLFHNSFFGRTPLAWTMA